MARSTTYEVRVGMSVYWVKLTREANGYHFTADDGRVDGWTAGNHREAIAEAKRVLQGGAS